MAVSRLGVAAYLPMNVKESFTIKSKLLRWQRHLELRCKKTQSDKNKNAQLAVQYLQWGKCVLSGHTHKMRRYY